MERGYVLSFRLPSDTPNHILDYLQNLKDTEGRKFSSKCADLLRKGIGVTAEDVVTIPLNQSLTKEQRDWLKHEQSEAILQNLITQVLSGAAISVETPAPIVPVHIPEPKPPVKVEPKVMKNGLLEVPEEDDDDLGNFSLDNFSIQREEEEQVEEPADNLLGGFLDRMNG